MNSQEYIEVAVKITPFSEENAEIVTAEVSELPFESFTSEDPYLKCYIQKELYDQQALKVLLGGVSDYGFEVESSANLMPAVNWNAVWESQFTPIIVDGKCTIKASFHEGLRRTRYNITIDPKMAFGTGHHQTTCHMVRSILASDMQGKSVLDMGCGTALLAILACKCGASSAVAIDIDEFAYENALENIRLNDTEAIDVRLGGVETLRDGELFDFVIANINRNILLADIKHYVKCMHNGSKLFISGFYVEDIPLLQEEGEKQGLRFLASAEDNRWAMMQFVKE